MNQKLILFPLLAMFLLACIVAVTMLRRRIAFYKANRVHPQKTATSAQMAAAITDTRASDNFRNLFEIPVLFCVAVLAIYATSLTCAAHLVLAWGYVAGRYAHSYIHCTSNIVMRRFYAFLFSCFCLIGMWAMLAYQLLFVA
jgi:hypothetical protein